MVGDKEGGDKAIEAANRTSVLMGRGAVGFIAGGPVGAVVGAVGGGVTHDGVQTMVKDRPQGVWALGDDNNKIGDIFDIVVGVASDGFTGYAIGTSLDGILRADEIKSFERINKFNNVSISKFVRIWA